MGRTWHASLWRGPNYVKFLHAGRLPLSNLLLQIQVKWCSHNLSIISLLQHQKQVVYSSISITHKSSPPHVQTTTHWLSTFRDVQKLCERGWWHFYCVLHHCQLMAHQLVTTSHSAIMAFMQHQIVSYDAAWVSKPFFSRLWHLLGAWLLSSLLYAWKSLALFLSMCEDMQPPCFLPTTNNRY